MMLKKKSKVKLGGAAFFALLFCVSYLGASFYAIPERANAVSWPLENRTISDIKYLQEMNKTVCDNSDIGDTNENVVDIRDDNAYSIGKLADGKCWMTQNLRLAGGIALTSTDSNVSSNYTLPSSTSSFSSTDPAKGQMMNSTDSDYGAYYSFNAATAGSAASKTSGKADYDICPKGWRLPTGGSSGEFQALYNKGYSSWTTNNGKNGRWLGAANAASGGAFFPAAGDVYTGGLYSPGSEGYYWSSTIYDATDAYYLNFNSSRLSPAGYSYRYLGFSVRCVANENQLPPTQAESASGSISVKVANTLSIDAVSGMEEEVDSTSIANGTITATIAANTNYKVLLSAEKTSLTSTNTANDAEIPALSTVQAGTNAWGIRNSDNTTYSAITTKEAEYYHTTAPSTNPDVPGTIHTFTVGISVSPSLPSDTYSTDVTITAAAA